MYGWGGRLTIALAHVAQKNCQNNPPLRWRIEFRPQPSQPPSGGVNSGSVGSSFDVSLPSELLQFLFYLAVALLIAFALYYLFRWLLHRRAPQSEMTRPGLVEPTRAMLPDLVRAAEAEASQGNYRLALRYLHTAVLTHLDRLGLLDYEPTNTDWEHLRALRARGHETLHSQLLPVTELVQRKWYGLEEVALEDFQRARQVAQRILARQEAA